MILKVFGGNAWRVGMTGNSHGFYSFQVILDNILKNNFLY
jgi:hypothetical protein